MLSIAELSRFIVTEYLYFWRLKEIEFGKVELVSLPKTLVASYEVISGEPEQTAIKFIEKWLLNKELVAYESKGVQGFGFDCHKERDIPEGCRIYRVYYTIPYPVEGGADVEIKEFPGGNFARLVVTDPFSGDFPTAGGGLLNWTFENNVKSRLGCVTSDECYSLFSNEDNQTLHELVQFEICHMFSVFIGRYDFFVTSRPTPRCPYFVV